MATTATSTLVRDDETIQHIEDERCYSAIRNGALLSNLTWHELTDEEQRNARAVMFSLYNY